MLIRKAESRDLEAIAEFQIKMAYETEGLTLDQKKVHLGVEAVLSGKQNGFYFLAEQDGKVAGSALVLTEWSDWRATEAWWIHSVYVPEEFRGQRVFSKIFAAIKQNATESKACALRLYVDKTNRHAQEVYKKLGMDNSHYDLYELQL